MRISTALLTAACIVSGIVVIEANPAGAQTYGPSAGYSAGYRPAYQPAYQAGYQANLQNGTSASYNTGYARPVDVVTYDTPRYGYATEAVAERVYETPAYQTPTYQTPVYEAPRYRDPRPVYVAPTCHEGGW